jgi:hypothetical protein
MKVEHGVIALLVIGIIAYIGYKMFLTSSGFMGIGGGGGGSDPLKTLSGTLLGKVGITQSVKVSSGITGASSSVVVTPIGFKGIQTTSSYGVIHTPTGYTQINPTQAVPRVEQF